MVKPDISRDYYADLELKPGADITEIKKAYKKLALKYHPDRNQGREAEFIPKFQAVNIANEILSDPAVKAKYDADRAKAGYRSSAYNPQRPTMPQRNGWTPSASASYYGPPPSAPPPRPPFNPTASSGATRFAKYTDAYQRGRQAKTAQEAANSRTETLRAFEKMKPSVPMNNRFEERTPPPRAADSGYKTPPGRAATPNAFDQGYQRRYDEPFSDQPKTRRKGWAPDAPGDEPPAQNTSAYASIHRSNGRPQAPRSQTVPEQPPPRPTQTAKKPDPLARFRAEAGIGEAERVSTPYASSGGERTYFNSATLNRSASTREGVHRAASNLHHTERRERSPPSAHRRHRSVSATRHRRQSVSSDSDKMAASPQDPFDPHRKESGRTPFSKSYRTTQERTGGNGKSNDTYKNQQGKPTFTTPYVESDTSEEEPDQQFRQYYRNKRSEEKPQNARRRSHTIIDLTGDSPPENDRSGNRVSSGQQKKSGPTSPLESFTQKMANAELNDSAGRNQRPASATGFKASGAPFEYARSPLSSYMKPNPGSPLPMGGSPRLFKWLTDPDLYLSVATANCRNDYSFAAPQPFASKPMPGADFRSRSTEEINAKFFKGEWTGKFEGNAANIFSRPQPPTRDARQRSPRRGQAHTRGRSQTRPTGPPQAPTPPTQDDFLRANRPTNPTQSAPNWRPNIFSPDDWAEAVKQPLFHPPPPAPPSPVRATPLTSKRSNSRLKTGKSPSTPARRGATSKATSLNATVGSDDEETSAYDRSGTKSAESSSSRSSGGGSAMEIDPPANVPTQQKDRSHGLPPPPDYVQQPGFTSGTPQTPQPNQKTARRPSSTMPPPPPRPQPPQQATAPLMPPRQAQPSANKAQGTAPRSQHNVVDLGGLKDCEPFTHPNEGLQGMKAMASNLPFESKAAFATTPDSPEPLRLPKPPRAPTAPASLNGETWSIYLNRMIPYVREWHVFHEKMLKLFLDRQTEVNGLAPKWLEVAGEPSQGGISKYLKGLKEDAQVREHWTVASEKHLEAMKTFAKVKKAFLGMAH